MGFRENLKTELLFSGLLVKELSAKSGVKKKSLDKYLSENGSMPSAEAAVKIARVLGVSVEYLVTGEKNRKLDADGHKTRFLASMDAKTCEIAQIIQRLNDDDRDVVLAVSRALKKRRKHEERGELSSPAN
jgi:transcriptional regulator with XRE-family HTH domain